MKGFVQDIEDLAVKNDEFRRVLYTAAHCQLVIMALGPPQPSAHDEPPSAAQPAPSQRATWLAAMPPALTVATATATKGQRRRRPLPGAGFERARAAAGGAEPTSADSSANVDRAIPC